MHRSLRSLAGETGQFHKAGIAQSRDHTIAFNDLRRGGQHTALSPGFREGVALTSGFRGPAETEGCAASTEHDAIGLGCVKTCTREKDAEVFSLSSSPDCGRRRFLFFKLTVSRRNFYWQIQLQSFHTA